MVTKGYQKGVYERVTTGTSQDAHVETATSVSPPRAKRGGIFAQAGKLDTTRLRSARTDRMAYWYSL